MTSNEKKQLRYIFWGIFIFLLAGRLWRSEVWTWLQTMLDGFSLFSAFEFGVVNGGDLRADVVSCGRILGAFVLGVRRFL
ncbi:MAG: hypothetical protein Q4P72_00895 [Eubacteriales bacterium]|nr:hypothetical protein [Eubacteriales bacterium]